MWLSPDLVLYYSTYFGGLIRVLGTKKLHKIVRLNLNLSFFKIKLVSKDQSV